ncbi:hypothetical protein F5884DRAFT_211298 [Xylogone sp. PMI_703]|nr:hypothetical protein F5884DRAFT_211298 [Xylogone sp. PMI_703]
MPSQHSQPPLQRPPLGTTRSTDSSRSNVNSPSSTPPQHNHKPKPAAKHAHVVGASRLHSRVPSTKGLHKTHSKVHANDHTLSHPDLRKLGKNASSSTNLKKNNSHTNLKRNRSVADVIPVTRSKSDSGHEKNKRPTSVHFEIGDSNNEDGDADGDGWEEASSTASPTLSRSGQSSAKPGASASNSRPHSAPQSPNAKTNTSPPKTNNIDATAANGDRDLERERQTARHIADAKAITERLLQRTPSLNTTKMSLTTATPTSTRPNTANGLNGAGGGPPFNGSAGSNNEPLVSRFVTGSGTPGDSSFLTSTTTTQNSKTPASSAGHDPKPEEGPKRARSMGNLNRHSSQSSDEEDTTSVLAPRSRKSSHGGGPIPGYHPPQQSRTQQKLWLQRASSNIEPQQLPPGQSGLGLGGLGLHGGIGAAGLVGAVGGSSYDGRDLRVKLQLERTGLEYLVVRRYQDPVGKALRRLRVLEVFDGNRKIPSGSASVKSGITGKIARRSMGPLAHASTKSVTGIDGVATPVRLSYDGSRSAVTSARGSHEDGAAVSTQQQQDDDGTNALLRRLWEKNYELVGSAD